MHEEKYLILTSDIKKINENLIKKYRFNSFSVLSEYYNLNKAKYKSFVSKDFIYEKNNKIFNIWTDSKLRIFTKDRKYFDESVGFGLKSGVYFKDFEIHFILDYTSAYEVKIKEIFDWGEKNMRGDRTVLKIEDGYMKYFYFEKDVSSNDPMYKMKLSPEEIFIINDLIYFWGLKYIDFYREKEQIELENEKGENIKENERVVKLKEAKSSIILSLDKDKDGKVDLVDGESFYFLLTKSQNKIIEIDKNYLQKFVKISIYLKTKKSNTQKIFDSIKDTKNNTELNELVNLLKNQIHTYELLVFHSISMITSLIEEDLITFYEIYECFDQLGVFNSNWENEVSNKLTDIGDGLRDLMYSIYQMENKIVSSIDNLSYVTQDSFEGLNISVNKQLSSIDSSIKFNNLLTLIQTYQMYKINKNTKRVN